jgi:hypothetical protein
VAEIIDVSFHLSAAPITSAQFCRSCSAHMLIGAVFCVLLRCVLCVFASDDKINLRPDALFLNSIPAAPVRDDESCWAARGRMIYDAQIEYIITVCVCVCIDL